MRIPTIAIPLKQTDSIEFKPAFQQYISAMYGEDPSRFEAEIQEINQARNAILDLEPNIRGRDAIYRYYGQLELLQLRFEIDEDHMKIEFNWRDAFSKEEVKQYSLAFEKASVIFNIAALLSRIAALADRSDEAGLKTAYNYFQASAGMFQYINDNFLHPPSVDLSRESVDFIVKMMLTQAQECFIEKCRDESKSELLIAKLAMHVSKSYISLQESLKISPLKEQFKTSSGEVNFIASAKVKYYQAIAYYHRSIVAEQKNEYAEIISYLNVAKQASLQAVDIAKDFAENQMSFWDIIASSDEVTDETKPSARLKLLAENLHEAIIQRDRLANKDNDSIYMANLIPPETLLPVEELQAVKCLKFENLLQNGQTMEQIIGDDIFKNLVPIGVHESSSVYSVEKDNLLRKQKNLVENANTDFQVTIESLNLMVVITKVKESMRLNGRSGGVNVPSQLMNSLKTVISEQNGDSNIDSMILKVNTLTSETKRSLDETANDLDKEEYECEQQRLKLMDKWTLEPSSKLNRDIKAKIRNIESNHQSLVQQSQRIFARIAGLSQLLLLVKKTIPAIEQEYAEKCTGKKNVGSLIDELGPTYEEEKSMVKKLEEMLDQLRGLKNERNRVLEDLREKLTNDDISSILLLNKGYESFVFQSQLAKFDELVVKIVENVKTNSTLLEGVRRTFSTLNESEMLLKTNATEQRMMSVDREWQNHISEYFDCSKNLKKIISDLNNLGIEIKSIKATSEEFLRERASQKRVLLSSLEKFIAEESQMALRAQLNRLSMSSMDSGPKNNMAPSPAYNQYSVASPQSTMPNIVYGNAGTQSLPPPTNFQPSAILPISNAAPPLPVKPNMFPYNQPAPQAFAPLYEYQQSQR